MIRGLDRSKRFGIPVALGIVAVCALAGCQTAPKAGEYTKGVAVKPLLTTSTTASGQPIVYPKTDKPEVRMLLVEIPPGGETGWHQHPMPAYAYLLSGSVTVQTATGKTYTFHAGEAFAETVGVLHNGKNTGTEPARILMTVTSQKGTATTEKAAK